MASQLLNLVPADAYKLLVVLFLSFLIGLEREEHKISKGYAFGGVRTYPLIGLIGYSVAFLAQGEIVAVIGGFAVVGGFLMISYWHKAETARVGLTSEMAGLATYILGPLVYGGDFWVASSLAIASLILLELKAFLEGLAQRFSEEDIFTFTKFLLLTIVILPILPNQTLTSFDLNPFKTWLVVVAVSTVSYGSFLLQRLIKGKGSIALVALLGGAYSSTVTTVALAKRASVDPENSKRYVGGMVMASGMMYWRLIFLLELFNGDLSARLIGPFAVLGLVGVLGGLVLYLQKKAPVDPENVPATYPQGNPLELKAAFGFALLFLIISLLTRYIVTDLGDQGVYSFAAIMGITDVDPFILSLTQSAGQSVPLALASVSILIATASNNAVKGLYARSFGDRQTGQQGLYLLLGFSLMGLLPILQQIP
ncbi:MgtC/SapB family protein [Picosynechococcus sp. NKBG15041c]|uniref:MgtC/SapB family protein n=1 Tax=Picosynechococcus sp. NKBG15041c TaxID=1407650 RepID=UPI00041CBE2C|nr:MgtC/SapB family protein [Picosynechococcus sp. NKBG15041c]